MYPSEEYKKLAYAIMGKKEKKVKKKSKPKKIKYRFNKRFN